MIIHLKVKTLGCGLCQFMACELVVIRGSLVMLALYAPSTLHWEEFENAALFLQLGVLSTLITTVTKTEHFKNALQTRGV